MDYKTTDARINLAIVLGAIVAGLLYMIFLFFDIALGGSSAWQNLPPHTLELIIYISIPVAMVWLIGLCTLGAVCWWGLHKAGMRYWVHAILLGTFLVPLVFATGGERAALPLMLYAAWGGTVGWVVWRQHISNPAPRANPEGPLSLLAPFDLFNFGVQFV